jgi:Domain of unknown function (DUF3883)
VFLHRAHRATVGHHRGPINLAVLRQPIPQTDFFVSANELEFSIRYAESYRLYRVFDFSPETGRGAYYVWRGSLVDEPSLKLEAIQFVVRLASVGQS